MKTHNKYSALKRQNAKGFSLLEMLLALGIFALIMLGVVNLMRDFAEREVARSSSAYMNQVMDAVVEILHTPINFMALYNAASENGGGYQLIADANSPNTDNIVKDMVINTMAMGSVTIARSSLLNENFTHNSPLRSQVRILLRTANPAGSPPALEILVITRTPRPFPLVQKAANEGHYQGGYLQNYANKGAARIKSAFNSWEINPNQRLTNTVWFTTDMPANLDIRRDGSFLAYYHYANYSALTSDYLFRTKDPTPSRELNTMYVPLNMNANNVQGADDVLIGNDGTGVEFAATTGVAAACDGSILCVRGTSIIKGSAVAQGHMTLSGNALIEDSARTSSMRIENAMSDANKLSYGAQGHLMVDSGSASTNDLVAVVGDGTFEDGVVVGAGQLDNVFANEVAMPPGGYLTTNTIGDAYKITASGVHSARMITQGPVRTGELRGGNVNLNSTLGTATTGVIDINDMQHLRLGTSATPGQLTIQRLNVQRLSIGQFGACDDCPANP